jgi:hypothetical protein
MPFPHNEVYFFAVKEQGVKLVRVEGMARKSNLQALFQRLLLAEIDRKSFYRKKNLRMAVNKISPEARRKKLRRAVHKADAQSEFASSAPGGLIPDPGNFVLKDVTRWKKDIAIPDVEKYDWEKIAGDGAGRFPVDRDKKAFAIQCNCDPWERLAALMGFEGAMIAMLEEPEACYELLTALPG